MGFQLLDLILIGIMLISGLLALMRGFTREVLSLVAWGLAALAAFFAIREPRLVSFAQTNVPYLEKDTLAMIAVGAVAFLLVLIIVSIISVKISDTVVDSAAGGFDRTLGFFYGLARGFVLVAIAYLFYGWLLPADRQEVWVREARSLPILKSTGETLCNLMPQEICETLRNTALAKDTATAPEAGTGKSEAETGYQDNTTTGIGNLIQGTGGGEQQPAIGQSEGQ